MTKDQNESIVTLDITSADFENVLGKGVVQRAQGKAAKRLGATEASSENDIRRFVANSLPKVLKNVVNQMVPDDFSLRRVTFKVNIKGSPLGVGVNGSMLITMGPRKKGPNT